VHNSIPIYAKEKELANLFPPLRRKLIDGMHFSKRYWNLFILMNALAFEISLKRGSGASKMISIYDLRLK
jgi:hypothetical protein